MGRDGFVGWSRAYEESLKRMTEQMVTCPCCSGECLVSPPSCSLCGKVGRVSRDLADKWINNWKKLLEIKEELEG